jgi:hypothetical protein
MPPLWMGAGKSIQTLSLRLAEFLVVGNFLCYHKTSGAMPVAASTVQTGSRLVMVPDTFLFLERPG